jgi:glutaredoxin-like protein
MRFLGAPAGYEFSSLVESILLAGSDDSGLSDDSKQVIAEMANEPIDIKVFVTPTCPHCPRAVTLAHRMAVESPNISAICVEASEFHDLSRQYRVTGVPKTVTSTGAEIFGAVPEEMFVRGVLEGRNDSGLLP